MEQTGLRAYGSEIADDNLASQVAQVLLRSLAGRIGTESSVTLDRPFSQYRLDSLAAARLLLELQCAFAISVPMDWLVECASPGSLTTRIVEQIRSRKPMAVETGNAASLPSANPIDRFASFALTPLQEAYLMGKQLDMTQDAVGCHLYREFELAKVDVDRLQEAWRRLITHHEALRIIVTEDGGQRVQPQTSAWALAVNDFGDVSAEEHEGCINAVRERMSHRLYDVGEWPLFAIEVSRCNLGRSIIHFSIDATVTDGRGFKLLLEQWWQCYQDPGSSLPEASISLRDAMLELEMQKDTTRYGEDLDYWTDKLEQLPLLPNMVLGSPGAKSTGQNCYRRTPLTRRLTSGPWQALCNKAASLNVSPSSLVLTLFAEALAMGLRRLPFPIVITSNSRSQLPQGTENIVGPFTSSHVFIAEDTSDQPFDTAAKGVHQRLWRDIGHKTVSAVAAIRELRSRRKLSGAVSLPIVFTSMLEVAGDGIHGSGFGPHLVYAVNQTSDVALEHQMWEEDGDCRFTGT